MSLLYTLKERPAKIYFYVAIIVLSLFGVMSRMGGEIDKISEQSDLERVLRTHIAMIVKVMPFFLVFAFVYWMMYKNDRRTHPILNYAHFGLVLLSLILNHVFIEWLNDNKYETIDHLLNGLGISVLAVFAFNVLMSLIYKDFGRK